MSAYDQQTIFLKIEFSRCGSASNSESVYSSDIKFDLADRAAQRKFVEGVRGGEAVLAKDSGDLSSNSALGVLRDHIMTAARSAFYGCQESELAIFVNVNGHNIINSKITQSQVPVAL